MSQTRAYPLRRSCFLADCSHSAERKQLAFMLARHNVSFECADAEASEIISNVKLHEYYLMLGRELEVMEANISGACRATGYCNIGCAYGAKLSTLDTVLPWAQQRPRS